MKDLVITSKRLKKELYIFLACFVIAFSINAYAVATYKTPWSELFTQIGYVMVITLLLYLLAALVRGVIRAVQLLFASSRKRA